MSDNLIEIAVERMREEVAAGDDCRVADHAKLDWCPCCGVNLRLYDEDGKIFAKLISTADNARTLAAGLISLASEMERRMPDATAQQRLQDDLARHLRGTLHEREGTI